MYAITEVAPTPAPMVIVTQLPAVIVDEPFPGAPTTEEETPAPMSVGDTPSPVSVEQPTPATSDYAFVGCFTDSPSARVLTADSVKGEPDMTADVSCETGEEASRDEKIDWIFPP